MWNISYDLIRLITPSKSGYEFLKTVKLYIPYKEIGLNVLVRKEQPLPFFYEIILKLVDCKCNEILNISELTGVEEEILNDVVGEMASMDLVYIKSNEITITPKGRISLNDLKNTIIEKEEINKIYINSITGLIEDLDYTYRKPTYKNPCLDEMVRITEEFITSHFSDFNNYYQKRQEDYEIKSQNNVKNEIYQIIGKEYEKLCYIEKKTFIFKNIRDNDLLYECENDKDNIYGNVLAKQIKDCPGSRNFLVPPFACEQYINTKFVIDNEKGTNTQQLIQVVKNNSTSIKKDIKEIEEYYFSERYLLENECDEILTSIKNIRPTEIVISSGKLSEILNHNVIGALHASLDTSKITIINDIKENRIGKLRSEIMSSKQKKKNKIQWIDGQDVNQTNIVLYPQCAININYVPIRIGKDYLISEIGEITFNTEKVLQLKNSILNIEK